MPVTSVGKIKITEKYEADEKTDNWIMAYYSIKKLRFKAKVGCV